MINDELLSRVITLEIENTKLANELSKRQQERQELANYFYGHDAMVFPSAFENKTLLEMAKELVDYYEDLLDDCENE